MKQVIMFTMKSCPYCRQAFTWMEELKKENPEYSNIDINIIDETLNPDVASQYD